MFFLQPLNVANEFSFTGLVMTVTEKVELFLIVLFLVLLIFVLNASEQATKLSIVVLYSASLLFCQSLLRDLWYLYAKRNLNKDVNQTITRQCMCVESTVGMLGVVIGLLLFSSAFDISVILNKVTLLSLASIILVGGFFIKDYVIEWNPWRLYKEKDHMNIIFSWKKP